MKRDIALLIGVGLLSVAAGIAVFKMTSSEPQVVNPVGTSPDNQPLAYQDLKFMDVDGNSHALAEWTAPLQVINFWAPWCAPCRREIPALIAVQDKYPAQVQIIGLAFDSAGNVRDFSRQYAFNYPLLLVPPGSARINRYFGNNSGGLPYTVILNADRDIEFRHAGEISAQQLEHRINALL